MANTCKDCFHYAVCCEYIKGIAESNVMKNTDFGKNIAAVMESSVCEHFIDRSQIVKLPYPLKFGDKIFYILKNLSELDLKDYSFTAGNYAVCNVPDTVIDVSTKGFFTNGLHNRNEDYLTPDDCEFVPWDEIGKSVFLTREDAEHALKEIEKNEV